MVASRKYRKRLRIRPKRNHRSHKGGSKHIAVKKCICFLSVKPSKEFYEYCKTLKTADYDVYICLDDISYNIPGYDDAIPIIRVDSADAEKAGFKGSVLWTMDRACSRDKALYHFCRIDTSYDFIWFIEDDVLVPRATTIYDIDRKYPTADLLSKSNDISHGRHTNWHWPHIFKQMSLDPPYATSLISVIRASKGLMKCIDAHGSKNGGLFIDEALFNTLALQNQLTTITPEEFSSIQWEEPSIQSNIQVNKIQHHKFYHPIKSMNIQEKHRKNARE